jgi:hypothetical protein
VTSQPGLGKLLTVFYSVIMQYVPVVAGAAADTGAPAVARARLILVSLLLLVSLILVSVCLDLLNVLARLHTPILVYHPCDR